MHSNLLSESTVVYFYSLFLVPNRQETAVKTILVSALRFLTLTAVIWTKSLPLHFHFLCAPFVLCLSLHQQFSSLAYSPALSSCLKKLRTAVLI